MKLTKLPVVLFVLICVCAGIFMQSNPVTASGKSDYGSESRIAFNFVDVEIPTVIKFISEITGNNFLFDERIKGKVTIIAPARLSVKESFDLFTSVLSLKGFTIIPSGPMTYKIIPSTLAKQAGVITSEDTFPVNEAYITKLIPIEHIDSAEALQFFRPIISRDGHISAFGPRNMLLAVDSAINIDKLISILKLIDKPSIKKEKAEINVYFLEHADATDLAKVLQGIIKELQSSYKAAARTKQKTSTTAAPMLSVTPDKATNSLVIIAPHSEYLNIRDVIQTLDKKRKQVYVEAMIVEAKVDQLKDLGSKWRGILEYNGEPVFIGGVGNISSSTVLDIITGLSGLSMGGMYNFIDIPVTSITTSGASSQTLTAPGFAALFSLSDFKDTINVLSTPQILTSDNEEAEILVGENVPFISQRERDVVTTNTVLNSIQRTDVGIKLNITPQITEGDYVKLDIFQEISAVQTTSEEILTTVGPTTTKRSTKTSVVVKDGRTVVIGGLMQEREEESVFKIPVLGDIPYLEWLFKFKSVSKNKTNLLVFLSPHIVKETPELDQITEEKHTSFVTSQKFYKSEELLVKFKEDVSYDKALEIIADNSSSVIKHFKSINVFHIKLTPGESVEDALSKYSSLPEVLYAEPNYKSKIQPVPEGGERHRSVPSPESKVDYKSQKESSIVSNKKPDTIHTDESRIAESGKIESGSSPEHILNKKKAGPEAAVIKQDIAEKEKGSQDKSPASTSESIPPPVAQEPAGNKEHRQVIETVPTKQPVKSSVGEVVPEKKKDAIKNAPSIKAKGTLNGLNFIQIGAWINIKYALETMNKIEKDFPDVYLIEDGKFNKVRIPSTMDKKKNSSILKKLRNKYKLKPVLVNSKP